MKRIAIIGGGIAGLTAAYRAEQLRRQGLVRYTLFEQAPRWGGVIATEVVDGFVVEGGPDSFLTEKPAAAALCRELGLGDELIGSNDAERSTALWIGNRLIPLPDGLQFLVPTRVWPAATTPLFSLATKLRFAREYLLPPRPSLTEDESVAGFVRRHFGQQVVERLADPLLSGIYGGSAERLSARAVLPRMWEMERRHCSLIRALLAARRKTRDDDGPRSPSTGPSAERGQAPVFTSLRGGMGQLVDALVAQLEPASLCLATRVDGIGRRNDTWLVHREARVEEFDAVVLALPAYAAAALLANVQPELARLLAEIPHTSSITIALAYDADDPAGPRPPPAGRPTASSEASTRQNSMPGFGFLVPRTEGRRMLACTFVHHKFPHRAPANAALLRCFIGGDQAEPAMSLSDAELITTIRAELRQAIGLAAEPRFTRVFRWPRAMAQYEVGHLKRVAEIERVRRTLPGLALAGNPYHGIGVPDCVSTGTRAIAEVSAVAVTVQT